MAIAITEKVRQKMGGTDFRVLEVNGMSVDTSYVLSEEVTGLRWIKWATWSPTTEVVGATRTKAITLAALTAPCPHITLSAAETSGACGTVLLWGEG